MNYDPNTIRTIIRIVQDHCFTCSASILVSEFALTVSPLIAKQIMIDHFHLADLHKITAKRRDFFIANDIDIDKFCKDLYQKLISELAFCINSSFYDSILDFKRRMENGNFRGYPKEKSSEDTLRCTLAIYIQRETFCEPRSGAGMNDITVPSEHVIIETKLWKGEAYYSSGFPELDDYLRKTNYTEGYYIIFDYNMNPNLIIMKHGETFDVEYKGNLVHVIFIRMNAPRPSKIHKSNK